MSNEITLSSSVTIKNGSLEHSWTPSALRIDQAAAQVSGIGQILNGTTPELLTITDITTAGVAYVRNLHTSATIQLGTGTGTSFVAFARLKAGEFFTGRLALTNPSGKVETTHTVNIMGLCAAD